MAILRLVVETLVAVLQLGAETIWVCSFKSCGAEIIRVALLKAGGEIIVVAVLKLGGCGYSGGSFKAGG